MFKLNMRNRSLHNRGSLSRMSTHSRKTVVSSSSLLTVWGISILFGCLFGTPCSTVATGPPPLNKALEAILKKELPPNYAISIEVADLKTGRVLMEKDSDRPLIPASTMKVATTAAALSTLKPDYTFKTEVLVDGVEGSSVNNIYLRGKGDPYLVSEQLFALTREVKEQGLREIRGGIIVDDSYFTPGKPLDEQQELGYRSYHAPYSALSLNFNTVKIAVHPGSIPGEPARVQCDPVCEYAVVRGKVKTVQGKRTARIGVKRTKDKTGRDIIKIRGSIGVKAPSKGLYVNVSSPTLYAGAVFKEFLLREGIRVSGKVSTGTVTAAAVPYLEFQSRPLGIIVYWLNKFSNNFMAEQISMAMGAQVYGVPGTRAKGLAVIKNFLKKVGVQDDGFTLSEASGLSRKNRLSASALVRVLLQAAHDFSYNAEFMSSLGVAGVDGTLKERFRTNGERRRLRAKTGSLRGITALAGYGQSVDGKLFAFAILINSLEKGKGFIDYADRIIKRIMDMRLGKT
jgi:serine-type D-Ala-D-Ala carboxypeptidase/endopeptidase (penicillin-binding protein 4)